MVVEFAVFGRGCDGTRVLWRRVRMLEVEERAVSVVPRRDRRACAVVFREAC